MAVGDLVDQGKARHGSVRYYAILAYVGVKLMAFLGILVAAFLSPEVPNGTVVLGAVAAIAVMAAAVVMVFRGLAKGPGA